MNAGDGECRLHSGYVQEVYQVRRCVYFPAEAEEFHRGMEVRIDTAYRGG